MTPLFTGLNGTLVATDTLWEATLQLVRTRPLFLFILPLWLARGKAWLRDRIVQSVTLNPSSLPYRPEVVEHLRSQKKAGRHIILATSSHERIARSVADHLGLFDTVIASTVQQNLVGKNKLRAIQSHAETTDFEYVGGKRSDWPVLESASSVTLVNPSRRMIARIQQSSTVNTVLVDAPNQLKAILSSCRFHHWTKNLLLAVPLIVSQQWRHLNSLGLLAIAIACFCFVASGMYLWNDLLDLAADRRHPTKWKRPLAKGDLDIPTGALLGLALLAIGVVSAFWLLPNDFGLLLVAYGLTALAYSVYFKRCLVLDVVVLAGLYTIRIFAGGATVGVTVSAWLMAFSMFFFLSLAFAKRYAELAIPREEAQVPAQARPYLVADLDIFRSVGPACGLMSVLVLALYINSPAVRVLYTQPFVLWLLCPLLLYWILRVWFLILRSRTDYDPVVLALRDPVSYVALIFAAVVLLIAAQ